MTVKTETNFYKNLKKYLENGDDKFIVTRIEISFDFNNWNKVTLVLDKPSVLIYFDDVLLSDFPIFTEYLAERIDIQWSSFYRLSIGGI